jgi:DNA-directed RNA polymerase I and III subunit RPAC2
MEEPKVQLLPGGSESSCTYVLAREDHTLGNALRFVCMRDPRTTFCGYSMPHPTEQVVNVRLQTAPSATSLEVFRKGLHTLVGMCEHVEGCLSASQAPAEEGMGGGGGAASSSSAAAGGGAGGGGGRGRRASSASSGGEEGQDRRGKK